MMMKNGKLPIIYALPHAIGTSKQHKVGWAGHVVSNRQKNT